MIRSGYFSRGFTVCFNETQTINDFANTLGLNQATPATMILTLPDNRHTKKDQKYYHRQMTLKIDMNL